MTMISASTPLPFPYGPHKHMLSLVLLPGSLLPGWNQGSVLPSKHSAVHSQPGQIALFPFWSSVFCPLLVEKVWTGITQLNSDFGSLDKAK